MAPLALTNQRSFAALILAMACALQLSLRGASAAQDATVIVIGAGISGIAAARKLADEGWDVIILEGRTRPGGRLWTQTLQGTPVDMGGAWIQGTEGNPLADLAKQYRLATVASIEDAALFNGSARLSGMQVQVGQAGLEAFGAFLQEQRDGGRLKLTDSLQTVFNRWLATVDLTPQQLQLVRQVIASFIESEYAASISALSALHYDQDSELGGDIVLWRQGYSALITRLAQGLDIRYGQVVTAVDYSEENLVKVTISNRRTYTANYVICTLPLGVLQSRTAPTFTPPLPARKRTAIATLGMGLLNKVVLSFRTPFWQRATGSVDWISLVNARPGEYATFLSLYRSFRKPVLVMLVAGDVAWTHENRTDAQIRSIVTQRLRTMFPDTYEPPTGVLITRWGKDPFSRGAYAYIKAGAARNAYSVLAEPVQGKLFFAGEATSQQYPATAHGAYWSGEREAERVINIGEERRRRSAS